MNGTYEQRIRSLMAGGRNPIEINWINLTLAEAEDGGADRCTEMLVAAGYRPDIKTVGAVVPELQDAYASGLQVDGKYVRLPQETWRKVR